MNLKDRMSDAVGIRLRQKEIAEKKCKGSINRPLLVDVSCEINRLGGFNGTPGVMDWLCENYPNVREFCAKNRDAKQLCGNFFEDK